MPQLTVDEERYDRQIRLWGAEAQQNLRNADILIIGVSGTGSEIVKNVVLSGINSMTLCDPTKLCFPNQPHQPAQMLIPHSTKASNADTTYAAASLPRCQELNPNVNSIEIGAPPLDDIKAGKYTVVCTCDQTRKTELEVAAACRVSNTPFMACLTTGMFGMAIIDAGAKFTCQVKVQEEESADDKKMDDEATADDGFQERSFEYQSYASVIEKIERSAFKSLRRRELKNLNQALIACSLKQSDTPINAETCQKMATSLTGKSDFYTGKNAEFHDLDESAVLSQGQFSPVCAVVGGFCAQEVIRLASKKEQPFDNLFLFDGKHYKGDVMQVK